MGRKDRDPSIFSPDPRNTLWANDTSKFGYKMLQRMGWSEGKGLGLNEDGQTEHIKVKKKDNTEGIGVDHAASSRAWLSNSDAFCQILQNLNQTYGKDTEDKEKHAGSSSSDDNLEESDRESSPSNNASEEESKKPKQKQKKQKKKKKKKSGDSSTKSKKKKEKQSKEATKETVPEPIPEKLPGKVIKSTKALGGRYARMRRAKDANNYSKEDMSAILGGLQAPTHSSTPNSPPPEQTVKAPAITPAMNFTQEETTARPSTVDASARTVTQLEEVDDPEKNAYGITTTVSNLSAQDYFKQKMAELQQRLNGSATASQSNEQQREKIEEVTQPKRKRKREDKESTAENSQRSQKKSQKKQKKKTKKAKKINKK
ncbi:PIN2/TERF1-interacting telomerase inhibitor 1 isoform X1 [Balamuthia mandrillaris]